MYAELGYIKLVSTQILMQKILSQSVKTLRLYIRTQNCVPMQVSRITNCVYIVAPTHIETVCALSKLDIHQKITVDLKMDELDVTAAETKATYEEIREYVKEHTGLNVSNLYIAQVKRKCGIKERQNYNKPKAENPKQLKCPPEKEKAIREALKYFKMI